MSPSLPLTRSTALAAASVPTAENTSSTRLGIVDYVEEFVGDFAIAFASGKAEVHGLHELELPFGVHPLTLGEEA
ncbi:MAG: hypothetical protein WC378_13925 [Opitutaceae bacterium]